MRVYREAAVIISAGLLCWERPESFSCFKRKPLFVTGNCAKVYYQARLETDRQPLSLAWLAAVE